MRQFSDMPRSYPLCTAVGGIAHSVAEVLIAGREVLESVSAQLLIGGIAAHSVAEVMIAGREVLEFDRAELLIGGIALCRTRLVLVRKKRGRILSSRQFRDLPGSLPRFRSSRAGSVRPCRRLAVGGTHEVRKPLLGEGTVVHSRHDHALPDNDESARHREGEEAERREP